MQSPEEFVEGEKFDEKNIRRRVYDALNVLMAMNIIAKEKKAGPSARSTRVRAAHLCAGCETLSGGGAVFVGDHLERAALDGGDGHGAPPRREIALCQPHRQEENSPAGMRHAPLVMLANCPRCFLKRHSNGYSKLCGLSGRRCGGSQELTEQHMGMHNLLRRNSARSYPDGRAPSLRSRRR